MEEKRQWTQATSISSSTDTGMQEIPIHRFTIGVDLRFGDIIGTIQSDDFIDKMNLREIV